MNCYDNYLIQHYTCIHHINDRYDETNEATRYFTLTIMWV